jgi:hypothetical protein
MKVGHSTREAERRAGRPKAPDPLSFIQRLRGTRSIGRDEASARFGWAEPARLEHVARQEEAGEQENAYK